MTLEQPFFRKPLWQLAALLGAGALAGFLILNHLHPAGGYWSWLLVIPVFFGMMGYTLIRVLQGCFARREKQLVNVYLSMRVFKILCTVILVVVYVFLVKVQLNYFLPTVVAFYLLHLVWETKFFFTYEGRMKTAKKDEKTTK